MGLIDDLLAVPRTVARVPDLLLGLTAGLESLQRQLDLALAELELMRSGVDARMLELQAEMAPIGHMADLRSGVERLTPRLDALVEGIGAMRADLSAARDDVAPMDDDLAAVESAVKDMAPALGDVREELRGLRDDLGSVPFVGRRSK